MEVNFKLKKVIIDFMYNNINLFNLANNTIEEFRSYIYDSNGNYLIGGEEVAEFIKNCEKLLIK